MVQYGWSVTELTKWAEYARNTAFRRSEYET